MKTKHKVIAFRTTEENANQLEKLSTELDLTESYLMGKGLEMIITTLKN